MKAYFKSYFTAIVFLISISLAPIVSAQIVQVEIAEKPMPFSSLEKEEENPEIEVSAVAAIDDAGKFLLAVDDEDARLLIVEAKTGHILKYLSLKGVSDKPKPKWEGLARDDEGAYYVVGSHSLKPGEIDDKKLKARSRLFRFRLKSNGSDICAFAIDENSVTEWSIVDAVAAEEKISNPNNVKAKVEGLAVRTLFGADKKILKRELVVGLREPDNPVRALSADITTLPANNTKLPLERFFIFAPGSSGGVNLRLSSIEYVSAWKGFLILTSTEDAENKFHGNALWFLPDETILPAKPQLTPVNPQKVWTFGIDQKAEGISILPTTIDSPKTIQAFLVYDNDGGDTHESSRLQKVVMANWAK